MKILGKEVSNLTLGIAVAVILAVIIVIVVLATRGSNVEVPIAPVVPIASVVTKPANVVSGRYINISKNSGYLEVAEVQAYDVSGNVLPPTTATGSAQLQGDAASSPISSVIDGSLSDVYMTGDTNIGAAGSRFVKVDYGKTVDISKIVVYLRQGCCRNMMVGALVKVLDDSGSPVFTAYPFPKIGAESETNTAELTAVFADPNSNYGFSKYTISIPNQLPVGS